MMQMFIAPVHEALDTKFLKLDESLHSRENIKRLLCVRASLFTGNTLVTAAFPFMGDFVNLFGSFTLIPLTFVFPSMIFIKVKLKTSYLYSVKTYNTLQEYAPRDHFTTKHSCGAYHSVYRSHKNV